MKVLYSILFIFLGIAIGYCQDAALIKYHSIGSFGDDKIITSQTDEAGNHYLVGSIETINHKGDPAINIHLSKLSPEGEILWQQEIGEEGSDQPHQLLLDSNGELLVLASSTSRSGLFNNQLNFENIYLLRFSANGELINSVSYGGNFIDIPANIIELHNGDFLISAHTMSSDGDVSSSIGQFDFWLIKINRSGKIIWERTFGGTDEDYSVKTIELPDNNLMFLGHSTSLDVDLPQNYGDYDISLIKLSGKGDVIWTKNFGGSYDDVANDMLLLPNGNILIGASTFSSDFNLNENNGNSDAWLFEVNKDGSLIWDKNYGNEGNDRVMQMSNVDGKIRVLGNSNSVSIETSRNNGEEDIWYFELDDSNNITNQLLIGSAYSEYATSFSFIGNDQILITGTTNSQDGIFESTGGEYDGFMYILKTSTLNEITLNGRVSAHPNPTIGTCYLNFVPSNSTYSLHDLSGREIPFTISEYNHSSILNFESDERGIFLLTIASPGGVQSIKINRN